MKRSKKIRSMKIESIRTAIISELPLAETWWQNPRSICPQFSRWRDPKNRKQACRDIWLQLQREQQPWTQYRPGSKAWQQALRLHDWKEYEDDMRLALPDSLVVRTLKPLMFAAELAPLVPPPHTVAVPVDKQGVQLARQAGIKFYNRCIEQEYHGVLGRTRLIHHAGSTRWSNGRPQKYSRAQAIEHITSAAALDSRKRVHYLFGLDRYYGPIAPPTGFVWHLQKGALFLRRSGQSGNARLLSQVYASDLLAADPAEACRLRFLEFEQFVKNKPEGA